MVIAIIAILAALLLPALSMAKLKAQRIKCVSNLKQLVLAAVMYQSDTGKPIDYPDASSLWMKTLLEYQAKVDQIRLCPSASVTNRPAGQGDAAHAWYWGTLQGRPLTGGYAIKGWLYPFRGGTQLYFPSDGAKCFGNDAQIPHPTLTPFFVGAVWPDLWPKATDQPTGDLYSGGTIVAQEIQRA